MNDKISMQSVRTLVRLETRARFGSRVDTTPKDKAGKALGHHFHACDLRDPRHGNLLPRGDVREAFGHAL